VQSLQIVHAVDIGEVDEALRMVGGGGEGQVGAVGAAVEIGQDVAGLLSPDRAAAASAAANPWSVITTTLSPCASAAAPLKKLCAAPPDMPSPWSMKLAPALSWPTPMASKAKVSSPGPPVMVVKPSLLVSRSSEH
jgi:hypothetical protein